MDKLFNLFTHMLVVVEKLEYWTEHCIELKFGFSYQSFEKKNRLKYIPWGKNVKNVNLHRVSKK